MARALFRGPTKGYRLTDSDVEWLARSMWCEEEAGDVEGKLAVAWTHIQRFLLIRYRWLNEGWTFARYLQAHSQPINPEWSSNGVFCRVGGKYYGKAECSSDKLAKRDRCCNDPVPADMLALAESFASGEIPNPFPEPTYDFAADWLVKKQGRSGAILVGSAPYNAHLTYASLRSDERGGVIPGAVRVEGATFPGTEVPLPPAEIAIPFVGVLLAGVGALVAWWVLRK
jgi:hypothetical protein